MTDFLTKAQRSALMAKVKGSGNASTERRRAAHCACDGRASA